MKFQLKLNQLDKVVVASVNVEPLPINVHKLSQYQNANTFHLISRMLTDHNRQAAGLLKVLHTVKLYVALFFFCNNTTLLLLVCCGDVHHFQIQDGMICYQKLVLPVFAG